MRRQKQAAAPLIEEAHELGVQHKHQEAMAILDRALDLSPDDGLVMFHRNRLSETPG